jgi:MerR family transcriptional regulator, redox-sensitive transcriptional activator SoxR
LKLADSTKEQSPELLTIGQVADRAGIRASSIRYYESVGVLPEPERIGGQRRYRPDVLTRLGFVAIAQQAGFSLEEIRELLDGSEQARVSERLQALAKGKLPEVEELIERAEAMRGWLRAASECECRSLDLCGLFAEPSSPPPTAG